MGMFRTVARFDHPVDAHIAMGRLESEGIQAFLKYENHSALMPGLYQTMLGGIELIVADEVAEMAASILASDPQTEETESVVELYMDNGFPLNVSAEEERTEETRSGLICPRCSSGNVSPASLGFITATIISFFLAAPPYRSMYNTCHNCGHEWRTFFGTNSDDDVHD